MRPKTTIALALALLTAPAVLADADITGTVFDGASAQPLDFATVQLIDPATGTPLPLGAVTDADGRFVIADAPAGTYIVRVSMTGSVTQEREINVADAAIDLGHIALAEDAQLLQELVVVGERAQMSVGATRRVFNVSGNIAASGASARDLLAAVPSVNVDADGDISLRGNNDVLVWIDGKAMGMTADNRAQFLSQIPADAIESIEVMTNPSARHSTDGTAGIINIRLKDDSRRGYFGSAEAAVDSRGTVNANFNINYNKGHFETFAGVGLKSAHVPGGMTSSRRYDDGTYLNSDGDIRKHENSIFLRLGANYEPDEHNSLYISAIGTLAHKWGRTVTNHYADIPDHWNHNFNNMRERGDNRGANILLGFRHSFAEHHYIDANVSYNIWQGSNNNRFRQIEYWADDQGLNIWQSQHQDVKISNWEAALDYNIEPVDWFRLEAGYKGNYNHENSPASYAAGQQPDDMKPLDNLFNRFKYDTDISAIYLNFAATAGKFSFTAGLRGEFWQIRTRSLGFGQDDNTVEPFKKNDFALFPSASAGWNLSDRDELKITYSRRIRRPFGPQLNTFENISDPSEVHLGNPLIQPEYSNAVELSFIKNWTGHMLSVAAYLRANNDMISHVSFLAPMVADPDATTMYYGHANVGNMMNSGVEIISRNSLFRILTLTTTVNLYNSHLKAWKTDYPLHGSFFTVEGRKQDRFVWDARLMASVRLPWSLTFQATGRYNSRRVTAQGSLEADWDVEAGIRKALGPWNFSLMCTDIFASKKSHDILYGNGYTQSISKWTGGRTLRLSVAFNFGKASEHDHDHTHHNEIETGGYGDEHHHHH